MNANDVPKHFRKDQQAWRGADQAVSETYECAFTGGPKLLFRKEVFHIVGAALEVLNELGHGLHEKAYENALVVEFRLREIPFLQQPRFDLIYKTVKIAEYVPDLIAFNVVVIDTKVIEAITDHELGQMINYLRITGLKAGLILNFKRAKLEWKRVVLEQDRG